MYQHTPVLAKMNSNKSFFIWRLQWDSVLWKRLGGEFSIGKPHHDNSRVGESQASRANVGNPPRWLHHPMRQALDIPPSRIRLTTMLSFTRVEVRNLANSLELLRCGQATFPNFSKFLFSFIPTAVLHFQSSYSFVY